MSFLSRMFKKPDRRVVGLDIGSSAIKAVQLRQKGGKIYLDTYGSYALAPYGNSSIGKAVNLPPGEITKVIKELLSEAHITAKQVGVAIPYGSSMVSIIELPKVPDKQLEQMIPLEARKYIPSSPDEVTLDWSVIGEPVPERQSEDQAVKVEVLLVAINNQVIERSNSIVQDAGLAVLSYDIEVFGTIRSVLSNEDNSPILIMDLGANTTKLYLVKNRVIRSSHTVNRGSQDITNALANAINLSVEEAEMVKRDLGLSGEHPHIREATALTLDYIMDETNRVIEQYQGKYSEAVNKVILTGGGAALKGLADQVKTSLDLPVVTAEPFAKTASPPFLKDLLSRIGPEFAVAIGSALRALETEDR